MNAGREREPTLESRFCVAPASLLAVFLSRTQCPVSAIYSSSSQKGKGHRQRAGHRTAGFACASLNLTETMMGTATPTATEFCVAFCRSGVIVVGLALLFEGG
jgi:hypothetical protein